MRYSFREGNMCADLLAKIKINQGEQDIRTMVPSAKIVQLLKDDIMGGGFPPWFLAFAFSSCDQKRKEVQTMSCRCRVSSSQNHNFPCVQEECMQFQILKLKLRQS